MGHIFRSMPLSVLKLLWLVYWTPNPWLTVGLFKQSMHFPMNGTPFWNTKKCECSTIFWGFHGLFSYPTLKTCARIRGWTQLLLLLLLKGPTVCTENVQTLCAKKGLVARADKTCRKAPRSCWVFPFFNEDKHLKTSQNFQKKKSLWLVGVGLNLTCARNVEGLVSQNGTIFGWLDWPGDSGGLLKKNVFKEETWWIVQIPRLFLCG